MGAVLAAWGHGHAHGAGAALRRISYRSDCCGDTGLVHGPDPRVVRGFDDRHPLLFLRGAVQRDGAAHGAVQRLRVLRVRLCGVCGGTVLTYDVCDAPGIIQ